MIRRFRLEQKSRYEKLVIAQRLSDMLDKFLSGRPAPLLIGAEQGGIEQWDDVVIHHEDGHYEHLQIKRQTTPFCDKHIDKAEYIKSYTTRKINKGKDVKSASSQEDENNTTKVIAALTDSQFDSELDKAMKSLAVWFQPGEVNKLPQRAFSLTLQGLELGIKGKPKDAIRGNHLHEFCALFRQDGLDLDALANRDDKPTQNVYKWLTTWCGFSDWEHVQQAMRQLTITCIGNEETLEARAHDSLGRHFIYPEQTLSLLVDYISDSTTDVNVVSCHAAARHLQTMLRPGVETWTQYLAAAPGQEWTVAGTHNLSGTSIVPTIDAASEVVSHYWGPSVQNRKLRLHTNYSIPTPKTVALPSAILRLALHLGNGSHGLLLGESAWRQGAKNELGSTLGVGDRDLDGLPWAEIPEALGCAQVRKLSTIVETRNESTELHNAMNDIVWQQLQNCVADQLGRIADLPLLSAMESKWRAWVAELTADPVARELLFEQLMYPETEGVDAKLALRIGPRTVELLETSILMLLLVCVGLGKDDANWRAIPQIGDILSIALRNWSGVATDTGGVRPLSEDNLMSVLGPSPAPVVILSGVEASPTSLLDSGMADDFEAGNSMAAERQPRLLVTRFGVYKHLRTGTLVKLQNQLQQHWNNWHMAREAAIKANGKGH
jgi:hypothetical protein